MVCLSWKTLFIHSYIHFLPSRNVDKEILNLSNAFRFASPQINTGSCRVKQRSWQKVWMHHGLLRLFSQFLSHGGTNVGFWCICVSALVTAWQNGEKNKKDHTSVQLRFLCAHFSVTYFLLFCADDIQVYLPVKANGSSSIQLWLRCSIVHGLKLLDLKDWDCPDYINNMFSSLSLLLINTLGVIVGCQN